MKWSVHFVQFDQAHWPFVIVMTLAFFVRTLFSSTKSSVSHHKPEETLEHLIEASRRLRTLRKRPILGIGGCPVSHFQAQAIQRGNITDSLQYFVFCSAGVNLFRVCSFYELPSWSTMHVTDMSISYVCFANFVKRSFRVLAALRIETTERKKLIDRLPIFPSRFRRHTPYYTHPDVRIYELNRRLQHRIEVCKDRFYFFTGKQNLGYFFGRFLTKILFRSVLYGVPCTKNLLWFFFSGL